MRRTLYAALLLAASLTVAGCGEDVAVRLPATPTISRNATFFFQSWQTMQYCGMSKQDGNPVLGDTAWMVTFAAQLPGVQRMVLMVDRSSAAPGTPEEEIEADYTALVEQARATGQDVVLAKPLGYSDSDPLVVYMRQTVAKAQNIGVHYWDTDSAGIHAGEAVQGPGCSALWTSYDVFNSSAVR